MSHFLSFFSSLFFKSFISLTYVPHLLLSLSNCNLNIPVEKGWSIHSNAFSLTLRNFGQSNQICFADHPPDMLIYLKHFLTSDVRQIKKNQWSKLMEWFLINWLNHHHNILTLSSESYQDIISHSSGETKLLCGIGPTEF